MDASAIPQGVALDDNMIKQIRSKVQDKIDAVGSSTLKSMGVALRQSVMRMPELMWMPTRLLICGRQE